MTELQQEDSLLWIKSSASGANGACVEMAKAQEMTLVRDSKDPSGPVLAFSMAEWTAFMIDFRAG